MLALIDHDTTAGIAEAAAARPDGLTLLPGVEISCRTGVISVHLLGYGIDLVDRPLVAAFQRLRQGRLDRAERMVARLVADGVAISWPQVREIASGTVGRPHVARALVEAGLVPDVSAAFCPEWIGAGGRYYVEKDELDAASGVRMVGAAGGVAVLAHPAAGHRGATLDDEAIVALASAGLAGLEVDHPDHDDAARARLRSLAVDLHLLVTGSSDFHGANKLTPLGAETTAPAVYESIIERITGTDPVG